MDREAMSNEENYCFDVAGYLHGRLRVGKPNFWKLWGLSLLAWMWMGGVSIGQTISTVAGGGFGDLGDGGPATEASLNTPTGVFVDGLGNLYIADRGNLRIRKVDRRGIITTVAGGGNPGVASGESARIGDGGPATRASLGRPTDVFVDGGGTIYVADTGSLRIRQVGGGFISTVAGGERGATGLAVGDGNAATKAVLGRPTGVFVDGKGNLYIADTSNQRIRKVDDKGVITTIVGIGVADFFGDGGPANQAALRNPRDVFVDGSDNLYIADAENHRIRKVDRAGIITTVAGNGKVDFSGDGGPATEASLNSPGGVFVDGPGNLYITDARNERIRKVNSSGIITTVAGNGRDDFSGDGGPATEASLSLGAGITSDNNIPSSLNVFVDALGNLYIADAGNHRIRKVAASLMIGLAATPASITADGVEVAVIQAQILNAEGVLLIEDNTTQVTFNILEGEGTLSAGEARVRDGIVETRLVSQTAGTVTVQVSAADIPSVTVSVMVKASVSPEMIRASDFNGDGKVAFADFLGFVSHFGKKVGDAGYEPKFDLDGDEAVGFSDFLIFAQSFGQLVDSAGGNG